MLKFSVANSKIKELKKVNDLLPYFKNNRKVYSLDILSGWSCPFADECLSKVVENNGKKTIVDGPNTKFRCFSASQEVVFPGVYNKRKYNFNLLKNKTESELIKLIHDSIPEDLGICRIHVGGDMFSDRYFRAWMNIASLFEDRLFYAYTKSLSYWVRNRKTVEKIHNFVLTASYGGRLDHLIKSEGLRSAKVVFHPSETDLEIDHTDEHAANPNRKFEDFALLLHGQMPKDSDASKAISRLKKEKIKFAYSKV